MEPLTFEKVRATKLANAFQTRQSIPIPDEGWTVDELLQIAGAAIISATARLNIVKPEYILMPFEQKEAHLQGWYDDLFAAVEFFADLTLAAYQDCYDDKFEQRVVATLVRDGDVRAISIDSGAKPQEAAHSKYSVQPNCSNFRKVTSERCGPPIPRGDVPVWK